MRRLIYSNQLYKVGLAERRWRAWSILQCSRSRRNSVSSAGEASIL